jgi:hypothetical protein
MLRERQSEKRVVRDEPPLMKIRGAAILPFPLNSKAYVVAGLMVELPRSPLLELLDMALRGSDTPSPIVPGFIIPTLLSLS